MTWFAAGNLPPALRRPRVLWPLVAGVVAAGVSASAVQAGYWLDEETLFRHTLDVTTGNC